MNKEKLAGTAEKFVQISQQIDKRCEGTYPMTTVEQVAKLQQLAALGRMVVGAGIMVVGVSVLIGCIAYCILITEPIDERYGRYAAAAMWFSPFVVFIIGYALGRYQVYG